MATPAFVVGVPWSVGAEVGHPSVIVGRVPRTSRRGAILVLAVKRKKGVRSGDGIDDEQNEGGLAVDVFGAVGMSQEELLAAALADTPANEKKTKKKNKKRSAMGQDSNEDGEDANDHELAPGVEKQVQNVQSDPVVHHDGPRADHLQPLQTQATKDKKLKGKGKKHFVTNENVVDVFGGVGKTQEELLAEAFGGPVDSPDITKSTRADGDQDSVTRANAAPIGRNVDDPNQMKQKKKKGKGKLVVTEDNAVDIFAGVGKTQEELLAEALGRRDGDANPTTDASFSTVVEDPAISIRDKQKQKKGKKALATENVKDIFDSAGKSSDELLADAMGDEQQNEPVASSRMDSKTNGFGPAMAEGLNNEEEEEETSLEGVSEEYLQELESFQEDTDVADEFQNFATEMEDFTEPGRRRKSLSKVAAQKQATYGSGGEAFTSIRLEDVGVTFRDQEVLKSVTWEVKTGDRIGLVGANGCGKSTQLKIIAGTLEPTKGEVVRSSKRTKSSFLKQEFVDDLIMSNTLREEFRRAFEEENRLLSQYYEVEKGIESAGEDMDKLEKLLNALEDLRVKCDAAGAWNLESRIDRVMPGLGFTESDNDKLVGSFSGGWKVRIGLGKVMLSDPDVLLLDEPTNHLDLESVEWIEEYLSSCPLPMVIVSHDREFMDRLCTTIVEIENGEAFEYKGNYSAFIKSKKQRRLAWEAAYEKQQKFLDEQRQFIRRFRSSESRASQVKSREKMLVRMESSDEMVKRPPRPGKPLVFRFPPAPRSARDVVSLEDVSHAYGNKVLFKEANIGIERGDKIAIIGPNGCGKSTLLRFIMKTEKPDSGLVQSLENHNIVAGYFEQNQADVLDPEKTVVDIAQDAAPPEMPYEQIRALLGKFLFKGDAVEKKVSALSGGEKARLALCKLMMTPANLLVLDEPTNHLDIPAKEMLEEALRDFNGTVIVVSHDRYFVSQVATQILAVEDHQLELYDGDYKYYIEKNAELSQKLKDRSIDGVTTIRSAPRVDPAIVEQEGKVTKRKRNFGGSGVASGKSNVMNAKRWSNL